VTENHSQFQGIAKENLETKEHSQNINIQECPWMSTYKACTKRNISIADNESFQLRQTYNQTICISYGTVNKRMVKKRSQDATWLHHTIATMEMAIHRWQNSAA